MKKQDLKKYNLPKGPGVYVFKEKGKPIYIGKATSLLSRVSSYFNDNLIHSRGPVLVDMLFKSDEISFEETESVLEALILEANLIKKYEPKYNTKEKDNKSYNYVCITKGSDKDFERVITLRGRELAKMSDKAKKSSFKKIFGPYPSGSSLREALKIIRKFFPFFDNKTLKKDHYEFYKQIALAPDLTKDNFNSLYGQNIRHIEMFFQGHKGAIIKELEKLMLKKAKESKFEEAESIKRKVYSLKHIKDISLMKKDDFTLPSFEKDNSFRIEGYDTSHISGSEMVSVMVVVDNGEIDTSQYKVFNIKGFTKSNDVGALKEVLERRFLHKEWDFPKLIVFDGNQVQKSAGDMVLQNLGLKIDTVAVVKDKTHKAKAIIGDVEIIKKYKKEILLANSEAHRFSLARHKFKRSKNFLSKK